MMPEPGASREHVAALVHDIENDLAAIRVRTDLALSAIATPSPESSETLAEDLQRIRDAVEDALVRAEAVARWLEANAG